MKICQAGLVGIMPFGDLDGLAGQHGTSATSAIVTAGLPETTEEKLPSNHSPALRPRRRGVVYQSLPGAAASRRGVVGYWVSLRTTVVVTLAATTMATPIHSWIARCCPRMSRPASAAKTGFTLMKTPKRRCGTNRSAVRSTA